MKEKDKKLSGWSKLTDEDIYKWNYTTKESLDRLLKSSMRRPLMETYITWGMFAGETITISLGTRSWGKDKTVYFFLVESNRRSHRYICQFKCDEVDPSQGYRVAQDYLLEGNHTILVGEYKKWIRRIEKHWRDFRKALLKNNCVETRRDLWKTPSLAGYHCWIKMRPDDNMIEIEFPNGDTSTFSVDAWAAALSSMQYFTGRDWAGIS